MNEVIDETGFRGPGHVSFILAIGCSDYDIRMGKTLEENATRRT